MVKKAAMVMTMVMCFLCLMFLVVPVVFAGTSVMQATAITTGTVDSMIEGSAASMVAAIVQQPMSDIGGMVGAIGPPQNDFMKGNLMIIVDSAASRQAGFG